MSNVLRAAAKGTITAATAFINTDCYDFFYSGGHVAFGTLNVKIGPNVISGPPSSISVSSDGKSAGIMTAPFLLNGVEVFAIATIQFAGPRGVFGITVFDAVTHTIVQELPPTELDSGPTNGVNINNVAYPGTINPADTSAS